MRLMKKGDFKAWVFGAITERIPGSPRFFYSEFESGGTEMGEYQERKKVGMRR